jgi:uncharacterized protein (DUF1778 family)
MDFYLSLALAVLFQVLKDKRIIEHNRKAFQKLLDVLIVALEGGP